MPVTLYVQKWFHFLLTDGTISDTRVMEINS